MTTNQSAGPTYNVEDIDPVAAKELLVGNTHNRGLRWRVVDTYAEDMRAGAWQENGESIKIAADGTVIDGQHRLHAIVDSCTKQRVLVIRNLPMETQNVVDTGAKRTFSDVLKLRGETNYTTVASITRRVDLWQRGMRTTKGNFVASNTQLLATLDAHPDIRLSAEVATSVRSHVPIAASVLGITHWLFSHLPTRDSEDLAQLGDDVNVFFDRLSDGADLSANHPVYVLRRTATDSANSARSQVNESVMTAYVIKAWNAYRAGRTIGLLRYRPGGASPESFPEPE